MKVLIICSSFPSNIDPKASPFLAEQVKWLKKSKVEPIVVVITDSLIIGRDLIIPHKNWISNLDKWLKMFGSKPEKLLNNQKVYYPKIISISNYFFTKRIVRLVHYQVKNIFKDVIDFYKPDIIHSHFINPNAYIGQIISEKYNIPHVTSVMGEDARHYGLTGDRKQYTINTMKKVSGVIAKSNSLKKFLHLNYNLDQDKTRIIFNGVDLKKFYPNYKKNKLNNLLYIGSFNKMKNILGNLLPAIYYLKEIRDDFIVHFVGDGPQKCAISEKVAKLNLGGHTVFHGRKHHTEIKKFFDMANILVLSSHHEGTPNVVMESLASGVPVVACSIDGIPDIVNEDSAILVPPSNPKKLAKAIDEALRREWNVHAIRRFAESHLDIEKKVGEIIHFYNYIIDVYNN